MSEVVKNGNKVVVNPGKDIVASMVEDLKNQLKQELDDKVTEIIFDLSETAMIDSMGIGVLIAAHNSLKKNGGRLELTNASADVMKLLQSMQLDRHFKM